MNRKIWIGIVVLLLVLPSVFAIDSSIDWKDPVKSITMVSMPIHAALTNPYVAYFLLLIFMFMIFYAILASAISKIKLFEGEGGQGVNTFGKMISIAITSLIVLAFGYYNKEKSPAGIVKTYLGDYSYIVAGILVIAFAVWMYKIFQGDMRKTALATAFASIAISMLTGIETLLLFAVIFLIIGIIYVVKGFGPMNVAEMTRTRAAIGSFQDKLKGKEQDEEHREKRIDSYEDYVDKVQLKNIKEDKLFGDYLPNERKANNYLQDWGKVARAQARGEPGTLRVGKELYDKIKGNETKLINELGRDGYRDLVTKLSQMPQNDALRAVDQMIKQEQSVRGMEA